MPGREIFVSGSPRDTLRLLRELPERERADTAARARARVIGAHTAAHRAAELERHLLDVRERRAITAR